jgi:hypothetical protein
MNKITKVLLTYIIGIIFALGSTSAFAQSTPPLDKPVEKPKANEMSESGRIQEKIDERRNKSDSPDSDKNHSGNSNVNPGKDNLLMERINNPSRFR